MKNLHDIPVEKPRLRIIEQPIIDTQMFGNITLRWTYDLNNITNITRAENIARGYLRQPTINVRNIRFTDV